MGIPELREALSRKFKRRTASRMIRPTIVTAGASEALHIIMQALVGEGDRVVLLTRVSSPTGHLPSLQGQAGGNPPRCEACTSTSRLPGSLMDGARLIVINSPGNPTGAVESRVDSGHCRVWRGCRGDRRER